MKLTGKWRLRAQKRLFRRPLLMLQVEETGQTVIFDGIGGHIQDVKGWRDARVEDLKDILDVMMEKKHADV